MPDKLQAIVIVLCLGLILYQTGFNIGKGLNFEEAMELVNKEKQRYMEKDNAFKLWRSNMGALMLWVVPVIGPTFGGIAMFEKGRIRGAFMRVNEDHPSLYIKISPWIEIWAMLLVGSEGVQSSLDLLKKRGLNIQRILVIIIAASIILIPSAIIEIKEINAWLGTIN